jgi:hypothetical protein
MLYPAVPFQNGMICIRPVAPCGLPEPGSPPDSSFMIALSRLAGTPYLPEAAAISVFQRSTPAQSPPGLAKPPPPMAVAGVAPLPSAAPGTGSDPDGTRAALPVNSGIPGGCPKPGAPIPVIGMARPTPKAGAPIPVIGAATPYGVVPKAGVPAANGVASGRAGRAGIPAPKAGTLPSRSSSFASRDVIAPRAIV